MRRLPGVDVRVAALYMNTLARLGVRRKILRLASGERMCLRTNDKFARRLMAERWFEAGLRQRLKEHVHSGGTVVDVGANIGYYTVRAATLVGPRGRVFAFEPQPAMRKEIEQNLALNQLSNVTILPYALSDSAGIAGLCVPAAGGESMGSLHANARFDSEREIEVETRRLDDVLESANCSGVDFMKLDAEGAELPIVRGASRLLSGPERPCVVFEAREDNCAPFGYQVFDLLKAFWDFGYRLTQIDGESWFAEPRK